MASIFGKLPKNVLIQYPSQRWGFVGSVDSRLAYEGTDEQLEKARQFGPAIAGVKTRSWATAAEALQAASDLERAS